MKNRSNIFIKIYIILIFHASLYAADMPPALFQKIIQANSGIKSLEADIVQYINTPEHAREIFKGKYSADNSGRFKIDYSSPSTQIVLNDGRALYWYYPQDNILYIIGNDTNNQAPKINPLQEFQNKNFGKQFQVDYLGKQFIGFFKRAHKFAIKDIKNDLAFSIWIDSATKVLLTKTVTNSEGTELIKEVYGDYEKIQNVYVPKRIDVYARTEKGVTRNTTEYSRIRLNYAIPDSHFVIKYRDNVQKKYL